MERRMLRMSTVRSRRKSARHASQGFTLVELAVVVTIVGVLAVIAVVGYRKYILNSKIAEAQNVIGAIKIAQEDHRAERGIYANLGTTYCPTGAGVANKKVGWNPACSGGVAPWTTLPVHVTGAVQFSYATVAGLNSWTQPPDTGWITWGTPTAPMWYVVMAKCDLDAGGDYTMLVGSSLDSTIFSHNVGE